MLCYLWKYGCIVALLVGFLLTLFDVPEFLTDVAFSKVDEEFIINFLIQYRLNMYSSTIMGADFILSYISFNMSATEVAMEHMHEGVGLVLFYSL